jgi:hypothetical protein
VGPTPAKWERWLVEPTGQRPLLYEYGLAADDLVLVPAVRGPEVELTMYRLPLGVQAQRAGDGWLHAQAGQSHYFYPLK